MLPIWVLGVEMPIIYYSQVLEGMKIILLSLKVSGVCAHTAHQKS